MACKRLIDRANENGGPDNITVIVARFDGAGSPRPGRRYDEVGHRVFPLPDTGQTPAMSIDRIADVDAITQPMAVPKRARATPRPAVGEPAEGRATHRTCRRTSQHRQADRRRVGGPAHPRRRILRREDDARRPRHDRDRRTTGLAASLTGRRQQPTSQPRRHDHADRAAHSDGARAGSDPVVREVGDRRSVDIR